VRTATLIGTVTRYPRRVSVRDDADVVLDQDAAVIATHADQA
jgi:hypothetical protein